MTFPSMSFPHHPVPLGFSDLTHDEWMVVSVFRAWQRLGPTRAVVEHPLARLLKADAIYPALDALFAVFVSFAANDPCETSHTELLSPSEEALLDELSAPHHPGACRLDVCACRAALRRVEIDLRPLREIHRSGHDLMLQRIAVSYQILFSGMASTNRSSTHTEPR